MTRCIVSLTLLLVANGSAAASEAKSVSEDNIQSMHFRLAIRETTPTIDKEDIRSIVIHGVTRWRKSARTVYRREERVYGIKGEYTTCNFNNDLHLTEEELAQLWSKLQRAGIASLTQEEAPSAKRGWSEYLRIEANNKANQYYFTQETHQDGARRAVRQVLFDLVDKHGLDAPCKRTEINLSMYGSQRLSLLFDSPVEFPEQYIDKKIERITQDNGTVTITFLADDSMPPLEGKLKDAKRRIGYCRGKTVMWVFVNPERIVFEGDDAEPRCVSLADMFKDPRAFHGKRVRVSGYLTPEFENMNFADKPDSDFMGGDHNVWLGEFSTFCEEGARYLRGAVTVDGTFVYGTSGHMSLWPGEIVRVTRLVRTTE